MRVPRGQSDGRCAAECRDYSWVLHTLDGTSLGPQQTCRACYEKLGREKRRGLTQFSNPAVHANQTLNTL